MEHLRVKPKNLDHYKERIKLIRTLFAIWLKSNDDSHLNNALKVYDETSSILKDDQLDKTNTLNNKFFGYSKLKKVA